MLRIKKGVKLENASTQLCIGIMIVLSVFERYAGLDCVLTAISDGKHMTGSKHYFGDAADFRSNTLAPALSHKILAECKECLAENFDFILEDEGEDNEHFHLEYDPKNRG